MTSADLGSLRNGRKVGDVVNGYGRKGSAVQHQRVISGGILVSAVRLSLWPSPRAVVEAQGHAGKKLKVVVFGGHPDDPESGAGGLIATLTALGHEVILAYVTVFRDDRQFFGRPEAEVRRAEASAACRVRARTPKFFPYAHEKLVADEATLQAVSGWFAEVKPDIVVTHWPLDTHPNHHAVSSLVHFALRLVVETKANLGVLFAEIERANRCPAGADRGGRTRWSHRST